MGCARWLAGRLAGQLRLDCRRMLALSPARPLSPLLPALPACLPCLAADPDGLKSLKFLATRWHIAFSSMLVLGLLLSTLM